MYTYKHHPMTVRDKDGVMIGLLIKSIVQFNKIHEQALSLCVTAKGHVILSTMKIESQIALDKCDLSRIRQLTAQLSAMDASVFFNKPVMATQPAPKPVTKKDYEFDDGSNHPTRDRIYQLRRRPRETERVINQQYRTPAMA